MLQSFADSRIGRKTFGKIHSVAEIPNLIEVQKNSYDKSFLQLGVPEDQQEDRGLRQVLQSIFPIHDASGTATLEFISYGFDEPKYDVEECIQRSLSFSAPLKVTLRLIVWDIDEDTAAKEIRGIKEQEVYMGDIPLMTKNGTFIINGTERVVVSQMHRSPGVFFDHDDGKSHASGKYLFSARIIPYRGSWLDLEFDAKDALYFRIDRKRKLPATTLLRAIGMDSKSILSFYYDTVEYKQKGKNWTAAFNPENIAPHKLVTDLVDADTGETVMQTGQKITPRLARKLAENGLKQFVISDEELLNHFVSEDIVDPTTGEVLVIAGSEITTEVQELLTQLKVKKIKILDINSKNGPYIRNTLFLDKNESRDEALIDIFRVLRPGEPPTVEAGEALFASLFYDADRYDLSEVGRIKLNARLDLEFDEKDTTLKIEDIQHIVKILVGLKDGQGVVDDIDHLGNRRVRSVGELIENQFRIGLVRIQKSVVERLSSVDVDTIMPHDLFNSKLLVSVLKEFFGTSQLSQFMDQTNPLSEITHKRRLSALGPGGLSRDRAGFEVRDVHPTHYGRICPIETPEGQNIGLINSLATYARVNKHGFIESPYRKVIDGKVTDEVLYLSAIEESKYKIAQAGAVQDAKNMLTDDLLNCRHNCDFVLVPPAEVDFIDVTPMQVVSVAASLIPFLENDDANRALMGSNMQRQAVPLVGSQAPIVGTGVESVVAADSGASVLAMHDGVVERVDATRIVVRTIGKTFDTSPGVEIYNLLKYQRSNHNTCINQVPLVKVGDHVRKNDIIADGPATEKGEIALGRNTLVGFIPWNGYNFEDSIIISERIVKDDVFTSVHIEEFEIVARDTRLGPEEITRDIPNIGEDHLQQLDESGIIHVGAEIKQGDILVGKVTPKSESPMTPEEKLLRAIFGEKASDVRDSSLYVPPGVKGSVVEVRIFSRRGIEKDERALAIERQQIEKLSKDRDDEVSIIDHFAFMKLTELLMGQTVISGPKSVKSGSKIDDALLSDLSKGQYWQLVVEDADVMSKIETIKSSYDDKRAELNKIFTSKVEKVQSGDDLPQGALKVVKVFVAMRHKLQPGDKMAGRHGNKGIVSRIVPEEDMPFLEDGTPLDVILNPLGVPSRMNVGQILETHLGWAAVNLGKKIDGMLEKYASNDIEIEKIREFVNTIYKGDTKILDKLSSMSKEEFIDAASSLKDGVKFSTPVFDGAKVKDVKEMLELADQDTSGQCRVIDGRTGEYFDRPVTVGYKYLLQLHHLVDDKIHARSIGPYSLVTQQPLGGKSHFGGQRFGEMECWALQAYGAAYTLQEMLTVKSDDVNGRVRIYESIIRGESNFESGIPESFNVMIKEFRSLCLNVQLEENVE